MRKTDTHLWFSCNRVFTNQTGFEHVAETKPVIASHTLHADMILTYSSISKHL